MYMHKRLHTHAQCTQLSYQSSAANYQNALDLVRLFQLLYLLVFPNGAYSPNTYKPNKSSTASLGSIISMAQPTSSLPRVARVDSLHVSQFQESSRYSKNGPEEEYIGTFNGRVCIAKRVRGNLHADVVNSIVNEVRLLQRIDHPNVQLMIGAKTTLDTDGIMVLFEYCQEGSIFDKYSRGAYVYACLCMYVR
jgi:hypothetical protein